MLYKKYLFALLKKYKWFYLAMMLLSTVAMSMFLGTCSAFKGFENAFYDYADKYGSADIVISTDATVKSKLQEVEDVDGVDNVNVRAGLNYTLKADTRLLTIKLITKPKNDAIIDTYFVDKTEKSAELYNIMLDRNLADNNNIKVGDSVYIKINGEFTECFVYSLVQSVETTFFQVTPFMTADKVDSGCVYMDESDYNEMLKDNGLYLQSTVANEILVNVKQGYDSEDVLESCKQVLKDGEVEVLESKLEKDTVYMSSMKSYLDTLDNVAVFVPLIFYSIALVVSLLFFMQIVKNSYKEIGILMMLGYKKSQIVSLFSLCSLIISLVSSVIGVIIGIGVMRYVLSLFLIGNFIPYAFEELDVATLIISIALVFVVGQIACFLGLLQLRSLTPVDVWTDDQEIKVKTINGNKQNRLPIALVLAISGLRRNPQAFFASVFAFFATYIIIFISLSIRLSINATINQTVDKRLNYDAQVVLFEDDTDEVYERLCSEAFLEEIEIVGIGHTTIKTSSAEDTCDFEVISSNHEFAPVFDINNKEELEIPKDGVIIDYYDADRLGISTGDTIELGGKEVKVSVLSAMYTNKMVIMSFDVAKELGIDYYKAYLVDTNDEEKLLNFFAEEDFSTFTVFSSSLAKVVHTDNDSFLLCTELIIGFAILIGFVVVCIVNVSSFNEQKRRLSIMRVLGYKVTDISNLWFIQFIICFVISLIPAVPIGYFASKIFLDFMCVKLSSYAYVNSIGTYVAAIGLVIAFYIVAHVVTIQTVRHFNLADNTRSRE